jgi:ethanolamine kinase
MQESVRWLLLASHLFWCSWALVQARTSSIDFDYAGYAQRRYDAFLDHRPQYAP